MPRFCVIFNCSNRADIRGKQVELTYSLKIVKNNGKEGLKLSKVVSSNFQEDLTERKLERTRIKIMLSASLSLVFSHKVPNIRF